MRFRILDPITPAEDDMPLCNLAHLFNAYMARLHGLEVLVLPQESLREYHRLTVAPLGKLSKADKVKARALRASEKEHYCLKVLNNSLHDMTLCVLAACNILGDLFNLYDGDLHRYAIQTRLQCIAAEVPGTEEEMAELFNSEDWAEYQAEWEPGEPGQPYRVKYKDDEESLAPYTVQAMLTPYFAPLREDATIEAIGSTPAEEFDYFTEIVRNYSEGHKTSHIGELGVYRHNAAGEYEKMTYAQRVESEVNEALKDTRVAGHFNQLLHRLHYVAGLSVFLTGPASYRELLDELLTIRDCTGLREPAPTL